MNNYHKFTAWSSLMIVLAMTIVCTSTEVTPLGDDALATQPATQPSSTRPADAIDIADNPFALVDALLADNIDMSVAQAYHAAIAHCHDAGLVEQALDEQDFDWLLNRMAWLYIEAAKQDIQSLESNDTDRRRRALDVLSQARSMLDRCDAVLDALLARIRPPDNLYQRKPSQRYIEAKGNQTRLLYTRAWVDTYAGLAAADSPNQQRYLTAASSAFEKVLDTLPREQYALRLQCMEGLATCLQALGQHQRLSDMLDDVRQLEQNTSGDGNTTGEPSESYRRILLMVLQTWMDSSPAQYSRTLNACHEYFASLPEDHVVDGLDAELKVLWLRAIYGRAQFATGPERQRLITEDADRLARELYSYGQPWSIYVGQAMREADLDITGPFASMVTARAAFEAGNYNRAIDLVQQARQQLQIAGTEEPQLADQLDNIHAAAIYQLGRYLEAAQLYTAMIANDDAVGSGPATAAIDTQATLFAAESLRQLLSGAVTAFEVQQAGQLLERIASVDPEDDSVQSLYYLYAHKLADQGQYDRALSIIGDVSEYSPEWPKAMYMRAFCHFKQGSTADNSQTAADSLDKAVEIIHKLTESKRLDRDDDESQQLTRQIRGLLLAVAQAYIHAPIDAPDKALTLLDTYKTLLDADTTTSLQRRQLLVTALLKTGNHERASAIIEQILNYDDEQALSAMQGILSAVDASLQLQEDDDSDDTHTQRLSIQAQQSGTAGSCRSESQAPAPGKASEGRACSDGAPEGAFRVACARGSHSKASLPRAEQLYSKALIPLYATVIDMLAQRDADPILLEHLRRRYGHICLSTGDYAQALETYTAIASHTDINTDADYLRSMGKALVGLQRYAEALPFWRRLAAGADADTEPWYQARYHIALCLTRSDDDNQRQRARRILSQMQILYPQMGGPAWKPRFDQLSKELSTPATSQ